MKPCEWHLATIFRGWKAAPTEMADGKPFSQRWRVESRSHKDGSWKAVLTEMAGGKPLSQRQLFKMRVAGFLFQIFASRIPIFLNCLVVKLG